MILFRVFCAAVLAGSTFAGLHAADAAEADSVAAGHSYHGEAFNEGPRQAAEMMPGMAPIEFPTSTKSEAAQG
ncbi:hypothetical protein, partial [Stieleria sp.]|uniref:hypothetical protein n=1 Tax=Stieleria sp. TaxID=2795976 RepID=UPI003565FA76